jgi:acetyl esterase/lipase
VYGAGPDHLVDTWLPAQPENAPTVIFFHGGFWRSEYDRAHVSPLAEALASAGFVVAVPEYRRTGGGGGWPATFDDVRAAVTYLSDRRPVILAGHSAGGHLALWAAGDQPAGRTPVAGVVALAPVTDLAEAYRLDLDGGAVAALLGGGPAERPERYEAADPMRRLPLRVPVVLVHGERDRHVPVSFSQRYAEHGRAAGAEIDLVICPDAEHFAVIDPLSPAWPSVVGALTTIAGPPPATLTADSQRR